MTKKIIKGIFVFLAIAATLTVIILGILFAARLLLVFEDDTNVSALDRFSESTDYTEIEEDVLLNVLVMGRDEASGLCDMLMLVSYNMTAEKVNVLQIPRDTYAEYTSGNYRKINGAVSALGGEEKLCDFLSKAICVDIDYYLSLDLDVLGKVVDVIGGVEVNIPFDMNYDDPTQGLSIHLKKGKILLDGDMARQFVRYRSGYAEGDLGRIDAQKIFLAALVKKLKSEGSLFEISAIATSIIGDVKTNIPISNVIFLVKQAFSVSPQNIKFVTLAGEGAVAKASGASYYVLSRPSTVEIVNEFFGAQADENSFDKERVFLNEKYASFSDIYYSKAEYEVYDASALMSDGIDIARR